MRTNVYCGINDTKSIFPSNRLFEILDFKSKNWIVKKPVSLTISIYLYLILIQFISSKVASDQKKNFRGQSS